MNFQNLSPVLKSKTLIQIAFSAARKNSLQKKLKGDWQQRVRTKESMKLDIVKDQLVSNLQGMLRAYPSIDKLPSFYQKLLALTLDVGQLRKSLAAILWAIQKIRDLHRQEVRHVNQLFSKEQIHAAGMHFYGRTASVLRQIDPQLSYLENSRKMMITYPDIKELPTVCIYGFPNVGKTTLLNKLVGAKAKVASYAFTTISINIGYLDNDGKKIQVADVPGTLARKEKANPIELQAELVLQDLSVLVIFVLDLSETSGYTVDEQEQLLKKVESLGKPVVLYLSKQDLLEKKVLEGRQKPVLTLQDLKEALREKITFPEEPASSFS